MEKGPKWDTLDCAVHAMVQLARVLKAHHTEVDQIPVQVRRELQPVPELLLAVLTRNWAKRTRTRC